MIDLRTIVFLFLFLLGAGAIFGLLFYLVGYCEKQFPTGSPLFFKAARIFLVVCGVLLLIGIILDFMGLPIVAWRAR